MVMKFRAHDTFFIRKGWLSKGMKYVHVKDDVFISKEENPMDVLGIGSNMVKALRYWLQAVELTSEPNKGKRIQTLTKLGNQIYQKDRYIEELGTLYLLQYKLAKQKEEATAWYYFFNEFSKCIVFKSTYTFYILKFNVCIESSFGMLFSSVCDYLLVEFNFSFTLYKKYEAFTHLNHTPNNHLCCFRDRQALKIDNHLCSY